MSNKRQLLTTPYHYDESYGIQLNERIDMSASEIKTNIDQRIFGYHELTILKTLYRYQFLNKYNLELAVRMQLGTNKAKKDYKNNLRTLINSGIIKRYEYGITEEEEPFLYWYALTDATQEYMQTNYKRLPVTYKQSSGDISAIEPDTIPRILERLVLNQWHINMLRQYKKEIKKECYYRRAFLSGIKSYFRSMICLQYRGKPLYIINIPYPKSKATVGRFVRELLYIEKAVNGTKSKSRILLIVICETVKEIEGAYLQIARVEALDHILPLFATGYNKDGLEPLEALYSCYYDPNDKKTHLEHFSIINE